MSSWWHLSVHVISGPPHGLVWASSQSCGFRGVGLFKWCPEALKEYLSLSKVEAALPVQPHLKSHFNAPWLATTALTACQVSRRRAHTLRLEGRSAGMGSTVVAIFRKQHLPQGDTSITVSTWLVIIITSCVRNAVFHRHREKEANFLVSARFRNNPNDS